MPVSKVSSVFPSFYSTNYTLGVPAANIALERSSLGNLTFDISHALCFRKISNISEMPSISLSGPYVVLSNYSLGDFSSDSSGHPCFGLRDIFYPINFKRNVSGLPTPPRPAPLCWKQVLDQIIEEQEFFNESFAFRYNRITFNIDLKRVIYFASEKRRIRILMEDGREHVFYEKLDELEEMLSGYNHHFLRIHKSYLVNERQIEQYHSKNVVMRNGDVLAVSREKRSMVCQLHMKLLAEKC